jgi:hypothetical protein
MHPWSSYYVRRQWDGFTLKYMLSGACGLLWPRPILSGTQATASRSPEASNTYPLLRAPGHVWPEARVSSWVEEGGGTVREVVKSCLPVPIVGWKKRKRGLLLRLDLFRLMAPPLQPGVVGLYLVRGVWFPSICRWKELIISKILGRNR